jgi:cytohesin
VIRKDKKHQGGIFMRRIMGLVIIAVIVCFTSAIALAGEIHDAVKKGELEAVTKLVEKDPSLVNAKNDDDDGNFPIHISVMEKNARVTEFLISKGADVKAKNNFNETPLHLAAGIDDVPIAKLLIEKGAEVNDKAVGSTPLHRAILGSANVDMVSLLIEKGADVNAKGLFDLTPLKMAIGAKKNDVIKLLRQHGAKK